MRWNEMLLEDKDRRQQVKKLDLLHFPNNCIGRINLKHRSSKQSVFATGFLISSSLVLTSAHTFTGLSEKYDPNALSTFQLEIYDNVNGTAIKNEYKVQNYRILYEYKKDERQLTFLEEQHQSEQNKANKNKTEEKMMTIYQKSAKTDFALLKLSHNIERPEYFQLFQNIETYPELTVSGFSDGQTLKHHSNKLGQIKDGILFYNIDTMGGQSGSPVFKKEDNSMLVGIHKGFSPVKRLNMAVMITSEIVSVIQRWSKQMGAAFHVVNPIFVGESSFKPSSAKIYHDKQYELKIIELTNKLELATSKNQSLNGRITQKDAEIGRLIELSNKLKQTASENESLKGRLSQRDVEITQLRSKINVFENRQRKYECTISELKEEVFKPYKVPQTPKPSTPHAQDKSVQIVGQGYSDIGLKIKYVADKSKITTLNIKNTVIIVQWKCNDYHIAEVTDIQERKQQLVYKGYGKSYLEVIINQISVSFVLWRGKQSLIKGMLFNIQDVIIDSDRPYSLNNYSMQHQANKVYPLLYAVVLFDQEREQQCIYKESNNKTIKCKLHNIKVESINQFLRQFTNLRHFILSFRHELCKHEVFTQLVNILNKLPMLESIAIYIGPQHKNQQSYDWTKDVKGCSRTKEYVQFW